MSVSEIYNADNNCASPSIPIWRPAVFHACFCKKEEKTIIEEEIIKYVVKKGDSMSKIARKHKVKAKDIRFEKKTIIPTTKNIHPDDVLLIQTKKEIGKKVSFVYLDEASIFAEVYIVIETQGLRSKKLQINVRQGIEKVIAAVDADIEITQGDAQLTTIECIVGEGEIMDDKDVLNKVEFEDWGIAKIKLTPSKTNLENWKIGIAGSTDKKAKLYLKVDAHSCNGDLEEQSIVYCGTNYNTKWWEPDTPAVQWLDIEGKWFELLIRAPWMEVALIEAKKAGGCVEAKQPMYNMAESYLRFVGNSHKPTSSDAGPWCAAFMNWCINEAGYDYAKSGSSLAPIAKKYRDKFKKIDDPIYGCIVVYRHVPIKKKDENGVEITTRPYKGHTGFLYGKTSNGKYILLGGNQGNTIKLDDYGTYTSRSKMKKFYGFYIPANYEPTDVDKLTDEEKKMTVKSENKVIGVTGNSSKGTT